MYGRRRRRSLPVRVGVVPRLYFYPGEPGVSFSSGCGRGAVPPVSQWVHVHAVTCISHGSLCSGTFCWLNPVPALWRRRCVFSLTAFCTFPLDCLFSSSTNICARTHARTQTCTRTHTHTHAVTLSSADADSSWLTQVDLSRPPFPAAPVSPCSASFHVPCLFPHAAVSRVAGSSYRPAATAARQSSACISKEQRAVLIYSFPARKAITEPALQKSIGPFLSSWSRTPPSNSKSGIGEEAVHVPASQTRIAVDVVAHS